MRCPAGHESQATDYCDVCGLAMATSADPAAAAAPATPGAVAGTGQVPCPSCGTPAAPDALFCEACGYDFTTGTMPTPVAPPAESPAAPAAAGTAVDGWVVEVWIDPDWYAAQEATDPLPSPGVPRVVALRRSSLLVGRLSRSRGITPDIDLSADSGISRRHAQLTTDGTRWWVEDLGSANGTFVGAAIGPVPTQAVTPGEKREVRAGDRIYLGAWTRLSIRSAVPGEV